MYIRTYMYCCKGRDVAEDYQDGACVVCCGSKRC